MFLPYFLPQSLYLLQFSQQEQVAILRSLQLLYGPVLCHFIPSGWPWDSPPWLQVPHLVPFHLLNSCTQNKLIFLGNCLLYAPPLLKNQQ